MNILEEKEHIFSWNIAIIERDGTSLKDVIREVAFPLPQVKAALNQNFRLLDLLDNEGNKTDQDNERLWFVCEKLD